MAYADYASSRDGGQPIQLFLFRYGEGATEYYGYTDHIEQLVVTHAAPIGERTYEPVPIQRSNIESNGTLDKSALRLNTDIGTDLAELFRVYPPANVVSLTIFEGHLDDPDEEFVVTWAGRLVAAGRKHSELALSGEPVSTSLRRPGLRATYGHGCRHVLYGPRCQANKAAATVSSTVASIDGATITLASGWEGAFDPAKFLRGMVEWQTVGGSTDRRMIIRVSGDTLSLSGLPTGLSVSDPIDVVLGCNHKAYAEEGGDCQPLHDNIVNFGGCRWIPLQNPIGQFNNYY
jgi:hypothetical protein